MKSAASYAVCWPNPESGMMGDEEQASSADGSLHDRTQTLCVMDETLSPATSKALMVTDNTVLQHFWVPLRAYT